MSYSTAAHVTGISPIGVLRSVHDPTTLTPFAGLISCRAWTVVSCLCPVFTSGSQRVESYVAQRMNTTDLVAAYHSSHEKLLSNRFIGLVSNHLRNGNVHISEVSGGIYVLSVVIISKQIALRLAETYVL